jgi:YidC/Oxa1 family membrane protein insertase
MERRLVLAIVLMIAVAVIPTLFMPPPPPRPAAGADSAAAVTGAADTMAATAVRAAPTAAAPAARAFRTDTISLEHGAAVYRFSTAGAALEAAAMNSYRDYSRRGEDRPSVELVRPGDRMLVASLVVGADTVRFDSVVFAVERGRGLVFSGNSGTVGMRVGYAPAAGHEYLLDVTGELSGLEGRGALMILSLGRGFANVEADSMDNYRYAGISARRTGLPQVHNFRSVDPFERIEVGGPFDWVAVKSKYFLGALLSPDSTRPLFGGAIMVGQPRQAKVATEARTWVTLPVGPEGRFSYQVYLGPQRHVTLSPLGRELSKASPYGWIFRPIVMPVSGWITRLFLWMHQTLSLGYGLVLVIFGVLVRLTLWPLNQRAMKSQVAMMAVQPILQDIQKRYKNDPQRLQQEMMKVYKEHKVNPLGGCLPLFIPLPVLLALFFVFANTIELRGAGFLWLPDLSLKDPLYIVPVVMAGSMWALSKLSQAGMPPNPQAKMMTTIMPLMMLVFFLNFASGLNLYYAVSNLVSLPQQFLINKARAAEMARRQVAAPKPG